VILYSLYYYDKEHLEPWLNHYCHIPCIDEIIIQDQNWSMENSLYLYRTVADYIDKYDVKIVVMPSNYTNPDSKAKRAQFLKYGQSQIRNRVVQFLKGTWILGAPDEVIYGESYADTNRKLLDFEKQAVESQLDRVGYIKLFSVTPEGFCPGGWPPTPQEHWKHRVTYNLSPLRHVGAPIHDNRMEIYHEELGMWATFNTSSGHYGHYDFRPDDITLDLNLLHYHSLTRSNHETPIYTPFRKADIQNWNEHPEHYISKLECE